MIRYVCQVYEYDHTTMDVGELLEVHRTLIRDTAVMKAEKLVKHSMSKVAIVTKNSKTDDLLMRRPEALLFKGTWFFRDIHKNKIGFYPRPTTKLFRLLK
jgi:hypothetical protein